MAAGGYARGAGTDDFADIAAGAWYETAVNWAASSGVASGTGSGFDPDAPMTREQFAAMLYRFAGTPSLAEGSSTVLDAYVDSSEVSQWAADAVAWAAEAARRGAGEILLTSMDADGTKAGFDMRLTKAVTSAVEVPVIASGGAGCAQDFARVLTEGGADAALAASLFHYKQLEIMDLKRALAAQSIPVRI